MIGKRYLLHHINITSFTKTDAQNRICDYTYFANLVLVHLTNFFQSYHNLQTYYTGTCFFLGGGQV